MIRLVSDVWLVRPASLASLGRLGSVGDVNGDRNSYLINLINDRCY